MRASVWRSWSWRGAGSRLQVTTPGRSSSPWLGCCGVLEHLRHPLAAPSLPPLSAAALASPPSSGPRSLGLSVRLLGAIAAGGIVYRAWNATDCLKTGGRGRFPSSGNGENGETESSDTAQHGTAHGDEDTAKRGLGTNTPGFSRSLSFPPRPAHALSATLSLPTLPSFFHSRSTARSLPLRRAFDLLLLSRDSSPFVSRPPALALAALPRATALSFSFPTSILSVAPALPSRDASRALRAPSHRFSTPVSRLRDHPWGCPPSSLSLPTLRRPQKGREREAGASPFPSAALPPPLLLYATAISSPFLLLFLLRLPCFHGRRSQVFSAPRSKNGPPDLLIRAGHLFLVDCTCWIMTRPY